jgi:hypothetical protein
VSLVTVVVAALAALLTIASVDLAAVFAARQQALIAAEAAAVAAADAATWLSDADPEAQANLLAHVNGATMIACTCEEGDASVRVEVETEPATRFVLAWLGLRVRVSTQASVDPWVPSWAPP